MAQERAVENRSTSAVPLIVVPCLDEARHIGPLLRQLRETQASIGGIIVIVDGGSTDGTRETAMREAAHHASIHVLDNPARVQSAGINLAVDRFGASATHLIRIDAHCAYPDDFCETLLTEAAETGAASVVVSMRAEGSGLFQHAIAAAQNAPVGNGGSKHRREPQGEYVDHGHHALIDLGVFRAIGGYDPTFSHNEDAEFDHRLTEAGHRIWLTGKARVTYFPRDGYRTLARQYVNHGAGRARNMLKHQTKPKLRQAKAIAILPLVSFAALAPIHPVAALPALAWIAYCCFSAVALTIRARDPRLLISGVMAMVMHLSWSFGFWSTVLRRPPILRDSTV